MRKRQTRRNTNNSRKRARKTIKKKGGIVLTPRQANSENISIDTISDFKEFIRNLENNDDENVIKKFKNFVMMNAELLNTDQKHSVNRLMHRLFDINVNGDITILASGHKRRRQSITNSNTNIATRLNNEMDSNGSETEVENNSNSEK